MTSADHQRNITQTLCGPLSRLADYFDQITRPDERGELSNIDLIGIECAANEVLVMVFFIRLKLNELKAAQGVRS